MIIQSGLVGPPSGTEWGLDDGTGTRTADQTITFNPPFSTRPSIVVGMTFVDFDNSTQDHNFFVRVKQSQNAFFEFEFQARGDTKIRSAQAFWLAYGEES